MEKTLGLIDEYYNIDKCIKDILRGGYTILKNDNGYIYKKLKRRKKYNRTSSHYSYNDQFELRLDKTECGPVVLVGTIDDNKGKIHTWFQFEKTTKECVLEHFLDYLEYKKVNKNIGPCGHSKYKDSNPLILNKRKNKMI
jgi:hypothetical protein